MHDKSISSIHSHIRCSKYFLLSLAGLLVFPLSLFVLTPRAEAAAIPGGNVNNQVVRAVDVAKPAVVRIITTLQGRLTVHFNTLGTATFPLDGSYYNLSLSGSGAFISANGDILTADHVIHPPHDKSLNQDLQLAAASDVADYINANFAPNPPYTEADAFSSLAYGSFRSESVYTQPKSVVYLNQDYTGAYAGAHLNEVPKKFHSPVDKVEQESPTNQKDVAIVHVAMTDTPSIQLGDSTNVAQQDELTIIGFPGNGDLGDPTKEDPNMLLTSSVNKIYVSSIKVGPNGQPLIQVSGNVEHGDSGGPALNSQGQIVGIVSFYSSNADTPDETSFLQASASAQALIGNLLLDTKPGKFEQSWQHAFALYTSTSTGHWHAANQAFKNLASAYPNFQAVNTFVGYTSQMAQQEDLSPASDKQQSSIMWYIVALILLVCLLFIAGILFFTQRERKHNRQLAQLNTAANTPESNYAPPVIPSTVPESSYVPSAPMPAGEINPQSLKQANEEVTEPPAPLPLPLFEPHITATSYEESLAQEHTVHNQVTGDTGPTAAESIVPIASDEPASVEPEPIEQELSHEPEQQEEQATEPTNQVSSEQEDTIVAQGVEPTDTEPDLLSNSPEQPNEQDSTQQPYENAEHAEQEDTPPAPVDPVIEPTPSAPEERDDFHSWQGQQDRQAYLERLQKSGDDDITNKMPRYRRP